MAAKYGNIVVDLRARIRSGELRVGDRLPPENDLSAEYNVSRMTLRKALADLRNEGLIVSVHGIGSTIADPQRPLRLHRLAGGKVKGVKAVTRDDALADTASKDFKHTTTEVRFEPADRMVAEALGIEQGVEVTVRVQVVRDEQSTVQLHTMYLPRTVTRRTALEKTDAGEGGVTARLTEAGHQPTKFRETVSSRMVTDTERGHFGGSVGLVLAVERVAIAKKPVQVSYLVMPANRFEVSYEWQAE
ncbi:GntR family transcriptional regulator [Sciscionella sediminilitoris]|uniref:GntR family transcriptional regulator n=1 Tax=Sciscionella sediminilitoris TaxID=1445613 RepID=UPI0004DF1A21|nr:GntR family transcriptional regulator [Sciscionella sp. SE31]